MASASAPFGTAEILFGIKSPHAIGPSNNASYGNVIYPRCIMITKPRSAATTSVFALLDISLSWKQASLLAVVI